jgi:hypothetical protein
MSYRLRSRGAYHEFEPIEASGGHVVNIMINGVQHRAHYFFSNPQSPESFTLDRCGSDPEVKYVVIAAGGAGGGSSSSKAGGGGAGGEVIQGSYHFLEEKALPVSVGLGGVGVASAAGNAGQNSSLGTAGTDIFVNASGGSGGPYANPGLSQAGENVTISNLTVEYGKDGTNGTTSELKAIFASFGSGGNGENIQTHTVAGVSGLSGFDGVVIVYYPIAPRAGYQNPSVPDKPEMPASYTTSLLQDVF